MHQLSACRMVSDAVAFTGGAVEVQVGAGDFPQRPEKGGLRGAALPAVDYGQLVPFKSEFDEPRRIFRSVAAHARPHPR